ncbi:tetratricopeptide repeat protein (plasmid) [Alicyclobacillus fastidiosus]|uniref:Tetratricopeptide repeat protein n=1 Tax=Alicyclobacillus fastidiosus TaxID=392011 RepID=A0ABY6ZRZ0_9BACL|nr:tetratricopeptide repeat protein [Alicyclobacillus fastidiosus]WAH44916.1 tetratricopeptide repeat protein [Alicyclobacillus fastidiosus]GMA65679.1 hypothetical protein GCM10025859_61190 [Alicyclobacillus fastidiosus]
MRYEEALDQFANALEVRDITELTRARAHQGVGACCRHLDRWTEAISHLEQACALFAVQKQHYRYILTLHNIGVLWLDKLQFEKAQELFEEVQSFYLNHKMYLNHAELCEEFARIAFYKRNYTLCNEWCNRGIDLLNGQNGPLAGRLFIWKSWCSHVTQYTDTATDAWRVAKCLLGSQLKKTIETFDPNMTEETKEMFYKQI